jgi:hypothetical protein
MSDDAYLAAKTAYEQRYPEADHDHLDEGMHKIAFVNEIVELGKSLHHQQRAEAEATRIGVDVVIEAVEMATRIHQTKRAERREIIRRHAPEGFIPNTDEEIDDYAIARFEDYIALLQAAHGFAESMDETNDTDKCSLCAEHGDILVKTLMIKGAVVVPF